MRLIGVYTITNILDNKIYVGCSFDLNYRMWKHKRNLKHNSHFNVYLQRSWNKYGENNFKFEILEECDIDFMYSQENYWCNMLNSHNKDIGYNIAPTDPNNTKRYVSKETRLRMGIASSKKIFTEEYRKKLSDSSRHLTPITARSVVRVEDNKEFNSISDAAKELNCHNSTVWKQLNGISKTAKGFTFKYI